MFGTITLQGVLQEGQEFDNYLKYIKHWMCTYKATKLFTPTLNRNIILVKEYLVGVEMTFSLSALKI